MLPTRAALAFAILAATLTTACLGDDGDTALPRTLVKA